MKVELPSVNQCFKKIVKIESTYDNETKPISEWLRLYRSYIRQNRKLLTKKSNENDIAILHIVLKDVLIRAIKGESAQRIYESLNKHIITKSDLNKGNYNKIIREARYRWGVKSGVETIQDVVSFFRDDLNWDFKKYFKEAEKNKELNFPKDNFLKIRNVGLKLRDLVLSNFSFNYPAMDAHISRILSRTGFIVYGYSLLTEEGIEVGNNPSDEKNYFFLHRLFLELSRKTQNSKNKYSPSEIDRILWHFGRSVCKASPECEICPIKKECLKGRACS